MRRSKQDAPFHTPPQLQRDNATLGLWFIASANRPMR
jgi:hypothetical protein